MITSYTEHKPHSRIFFHETFACNLIDDAIEHGLVRKPKSGSSGDKILAAHRKNGDINPFNKVAALEMFVWGEWALLPNQFNAISQIESLRPNGLMLAQDGIWEVPERQEAEVVTSYLEPNGAKELKPFILRNLNHRGYPINEQRFDKIVDLWQQYASAYTLELVMSGSKKYHDKIGYENEDVGIKQNEILENLKRKLKKLAPKLTTDVRSDIFEISREAGFLGESLFLSGYGIHTFSPIPTISDIQVMTIKPQNDHLSSLLTFYFENTIYCPSPKNVEDAIELRNNKSVVAWRNQIRKWSLELASGKSELKTVKKEIEAANDYVKGARFLSRLIPFWSILVTLPVNMATELIPEFHSYQTLARTLDIGVGLFQLYGGLVEKAVESPSRLRHQWLMISNKK